MLMQDNQSCMLLYNNHPFSVGKESKHVNVRHFFIVDKIDKREVRITCCPKVEMVSDFSTKLLQGKIFVTHRNNMLGVTMEEHGRHKKWHREARQRCDLWDDLGNDLDHL